jgi:hypothetical protein
MIDSTIDEVRDAGFMEKRCLQVAGFTDPGYSASAATIAACDRLHHDWLFW